MSLLFVLSKLYNGNAGAAFPKLSKPVGGHMPAVSEKLVHGFFQCACTAAVNDTDLGKMGQIGIVKIFVQLGNGLVRGLPDEVDLRRDREGFGHGSISAA